MNIEQRLKISKWTISLSCSVAIISVVVIDYYSNGEQGMPLSIGFIFATLLVKSVSSIILNFVKDTYSQP